MPDTYQPDDALVAERALRAMIEGGHLPSDGRLPAERELAAELQVGRRAVRRAIEALERGGVIWRRQGKGTFAGQAPDPAAIMAAHAAPDVDPMTVMQARALIEPGLARLAASRATPEDSERLRRLADRTVASEDAGQAELWDGALHRCIARIAGNPILLTTFGFLDEVRRGAGWQADRHRARSPETMADYDAQHRAIVRAVAAGDGDAAEDAMRGHLAAVAARLGAALESRT